MLTNILTRITEVLELLLSVSKPTDFSLQQLDWVIDTVTTLHGQVLSLKYYIPPDVLQRNKTVLVIQQQQTRVSEVFSSLFQQWKNNSLNFDDSQTSESSTCPTISPTSDSNITSTPSVCIVDSKTSESSTCPRISPTSDSDTTSTSSGSYAAADNSEHVTSASIKLNVSLSATSSEQSKDACVVIIPENAENKNVRDKVPKRTPAYPRLTDESRSSAPDRVVKVKVVDNGPSSSPKNISLMCFMTLVFVQNVASCGGFFGTIQYRWSGHKDYGGAGSTLSLPLTINDDNDFR